MSEQEMVKVYELAKELGIDSISLLDKLKNLNIKVKNHMSDLKAEEVRIARSSLRRDTGSEKPAKGQSRRKKAPDSSVQSGLSAAESVSAEKRPSSPIIRRRSRSDQSSEVQSSVVPPSPAPALHAAQVKGKEEGLARSKEEGAELADVESAVAVSVSEAAEGIAEQTEEQSTFLDSSETASPSSLPLGKEDQGIEGETASPSSPIKVESRDEEVPSETKQKAPSSATIERASTSSVSQTKTVLSAESNIHGEKRTVSPTASSQHPMTNHPSTVSSSDTGPRIHPPASTTVTNVSSTSTKEASAQPGPKKATTRPPIVFTPRPVAPRRSILKIVEPTTPPPRPIIKPAPAVQPKVPVKGTATQDKDGFRIIKMTKENLDQMIEEEAAKKRGGGREQELHPEDVRFADYRKKELVFLPKRKKLPVGKELRKTQRTVAKAQKRIIEMRETISIPDLANQLCVKATDVLRKLIGLGHMTTINQTIDFDTATLVAHEYQYEVRNTAFNEQDFIGTAKDPEEDLQPRPPVVTIMGHVDHGKTTLLDAIREANVAGGEAGGITQHMGAYTIEKNGKMITFIDTPGHEAFTVMRARGANVTDIVILVVAADDGVMPQTREALSHAQAAKVPIIVAVNKIDKPSANPEKIKQGLAELNLLAEDWGGDTMFVPVSALKHTNLDKLLDSVLLQAEILDLKANPNARASGTVLEARLEKGRGPVMSVLINRGTLSVGDAIVSGPFSGKVKALTDDKGHAVLSGTPGTAVEVLGLEGVPNAGEAFNSTESELDARRIASNRVDIARAPQTAGKVSLEQLFSKIQAGDVKELNVIVKADAFGSVEAIRDSLVKASTEKVKVKPILAAAGGISESDVLLASASNAIIIGFNVRPETKARQLAEAEHVEVKCYNIIYELIDDVKKAMTGLLDKKKVEKFMGRAEVRQTFTVPRIGMIAGASVIDGKMSRSSNVRLLRDSRVIFEGKMSSLKRFKDDVKEVATGFECGIGIENYNDLKTGDIIEAFQIELVAPELDA